MILNLSDQSAETLQGQIVRQVRALILAGDLEAGSDLTSIRMLAAEQRVSVITVQRAYEALEREQLIKARRGRGFIVRELSLRERQEFALLQLDRALAPVLEQARAEGLTEADVIARVKSIMSEVSV